MGSSGPLVHMSFPEIEGAWERGKRLNSISAFPKIPLESDSPRLHGGKGVA